MTSPPGDWSGLVVLVAGSAWDGPRFASQHVANELTRYAPVLYVDPPSRAGFGACGIDVVAPRLARLRTPGVRRRAVGRRLTSALARRTLRAAVARLGDDVEAVLAFSPTNRLFGVCGERTSVYYAKDDFSAAGDLLAGSAARAGAAEEWAAAHADRVIAHSPPLMERWRAYDPVFIPNGVDARAFAASDTVPPAPDVDLPHPIAGFVGHLSNRIDTALLEAVADRGTSLLLVGPRQSTFDVARLDRLLALPHVRWVGARAFDALPSYLSHVDVGLVPYTRSAFNVASFPLKTLEYLAAGRPVVSTDLPASRWLDTSHVTIANGPVEFAEAVAGSCAVARVPELADARRALAREHDWSHRVDRLAEVLLLGPPKPTAPSARD